MSSLIFECLLTSVVRKRNMPIQTVKLGFALMNGLQEDELFLERKLDIIGNAQNIFSSLILRLQNLYFKYFEQRCLLKRMCHICYMFSAFHRVNCCFPQSELFSICFIKVEGHPGKFLQQFHNYVQIQYLAPEYTRLCETIHS